MKTKHELGRKNGKPYTLEYDKRKYQMACDYEHRNEWRWFLHVDGDYVGDFRTRKDAFLFYDVLCCSTEATNS